MDLSAAVLGQHGNVCDVGSLELTDGPVFEDDGRTGIRLSCDRIGVDNGRSDACRRCCEAKIRQLDLSLTRVAALTLRCGMLILP
jgi:hypothetical protein